MKPSYIIERWEYGWLICGDGERSGIPMDALQECMALFPKKAVMDPGVARCYRYERNAVVCIGRPHELNLWSKEIEKSIEWMSDEPRWFNGCDCGQSSIALFSKLAEDGDLRNRAFRETNERYPAPQDADDFGRCYRLVELMKWHDRITEMKGASEQWDWIVARWASLCTQFKNGKMETFFKS